MAAANRDRFQDKDTMSLGNWLDNFNLFSLHDLFCDERNLFRSFSLNRYGT